MMIQRSVLAASAFILGAGPAMAAGTAGIAQALQAARQTVAQHSDEFTLDGSKGGRDALELSWSLTADWTATYLNEHPKATPNEIGAALPIFRGTQFDIDEIAPATYLATPRYGEIGTVFIVARQDGAFHPVWTIRDTANAKRFAILAGWTTAGADDACRSKDGQWPRCGPLYGDYLALPADSHGRPRFAIMGIHAQPFGETLSGQLSIWVWDGSKAAPLLAKTYGTMMEDTGAQLRGDVLTIRAKDEYKMFMSCGACSGRRLDWTIRLAPDGVQDLGRKPLVPEMDAIDDALLRAWQNRPIAAPPAVLATLKAAVREARSQDADGGAIPSFGMLDANTLHREKAQTVVCLAVDSLEHPLQFRVAQMGAGYVLTDAKSLEKLEMRCPP